MSYIKLFNQTLQIPYMCVAAVVKNKAGSPMNISASSLGDNVYFSDLYTDTGATNPVVSGLNSNVTVTPSQGADFNKFMLRNSAFVSKNAGLGPVAVGEAILFNHLYNYNYLIRRNSYDLLDLCPPLPAADEFSSAANKTYIYVGVSDPGLTIEARTWKSSNTQWYKQLIFSNLIDGVSYTWTGFTSYWISNGIFVSKYNGDYHAYFAEYGDSGVITGFIIQSVGFANIAQAHDLNPNKVELGFGTSSAISTMLNQSTTIDTDSNNQGGNSGPGGGGGTFDDTSDQINVPALPTLSATKAGFVTLYKPTLNNLLDLSSYLWSTNIVNILIQYFANPMDIIIGLGIVPVSAPASSSDYPSAGQITIPFSIPVYDSQYYEHDCGSITLEEFWGSALDYAPYTSADIYLPYIGVRSLNVDEIMGKSIGVTYHIDLYGGAVCAFVTVDGSVRYQFTGNCMQQVPVNAANYDALIQNLVSVACVVGSGLAAAGSAGAAAAVGEEAATIGAGEMSQSQAITKGLVGKEYADVRALGFKEWASMGGGKSLANCTVSSIMAAKPVVERTGAVSSTNGQLALQTPFLIVQRPRQSLPENYKHYGGYPSNITSKLGDLNGYTEVDSIRINDLAATESELVEIYQLLKKGVII